MVRHFRRITQVVALTFVLLFCTLLVVGSFDTLGWSDEHHTHRHEIQEHRILLGIYYSYHETTEYYFRESCCP